MSFKVINEVDTFSYRDSYTTGAQISDDAIQLTVEALIVKSNNSANSNYTNSYAGETRIKFSNAQICNLKKLGYRKFDANDNLIESVEDREEPFNTIEMNKFFEKVFLTGIRSEAENVYSVTIEIPDEDPSAVTDEYELTVECTKVTISWEEYMNRVSDM